jgi:hypothetical protein
MSLRRLVATAAVLATAGLASASAAQAAFHLVQIREVFPGTAANPNSEYVVLQMWASGQNIVSGHSVRTFGPNGMPTGTTTFNGNVPNGANQATILLATAEAGGAPDVQMPAAGLDPSGGAVCWEQGLDCVAWGNFSGSLSSPTGTPAPAIPDGSALRRSIAPGCSTLLESIDDTNNSSVDFTAAAPAPRNNAATITEAACTGAVGQTPPRTSLRKKPPKRTRDRTPSFRFTADQAGAAFQCKVDRKPFRTCRSPYTTKPLKPGKHTFKVRAQTAAGADSSPASFTFTVLGKR